MPVCAAREPRTLLPPRWPLACIGLPHKASLGSTPRARGGHARHYGGRSRDAGATDRCITADRRRRPPLRPSLRARPPPLRYRRCTSTPPPRPPCWRSRRGDAASTISPNRTDICPSIRRDVSSASTELPVNGVDRLSCRNARPWPSAEQGQWDAHRRQTGSPPSPIHVGQGGVIDSVYSR
jgi:hypothetical protein